MQISINDPSHVIRILLIKLLLHDVLTIEYLRGLSIKSKVSKWSRACVYLVYIGQISQLITATATFIRGSYVSSFTYDTIFAFSVNTEIIILAYRYGKQRKAFVHPHAFAFTKPFTRILIQFSCTVYKPFMYSKVFNMFIRFNDCTKMFHKMYMNFAKIQYRGKINIQENIQDLCVV